MSDGYPASLRRSIAVLESTRAARLQQTPPRIPADQVQALLAAHHPDYRPTAKRPIGVGPSAGAPAPCELVDLLEARPAVDPAQIDLTHVDLDLDLLIIGGGGAGTCAALWAVERGVAPERIRLVTKLRHGDANTMMAQGGIQVALGETDSPAQHYLDVLGGAHFSNRPELVQALVEDAPLIVAWHERLGVLYDRRDDDQMVRRHGGGTSRKRMVSAKDYTGMEIMRVLRDEARNIGLQALELTAAAELLTDARGRCAGAVLYDLETREYRVARARATILATGGFGRLHIQGFATTNHYGATADGLVLGYRAGVPLRDTDSVQYHPTGAAFPEQLVGLLITEKLRSMGAQPVNARGEAFVYPLEPRDVESAALIRECSERGNGIVTPTGFTGVWLDAPMIDRIHGEGAIRANLSAMWRMVQRFDIDITVDPILVYPTLHYQNGGLAIDPWGRTAVPGLYAAGEVAGGIHGKNRLMGNSLLGVNVFGRRAGIAAAEAIAAGEQAGAPTLDHVHRHVALLREAGLDSARTSPLLLPDYRRAEALARRLDLLR